MARGFLQPVTVIFGIWFCSWYAECVLSAFCACDRDSDTHTHTHTHIYIYIYIYTHIYIIVIWDDAFWFWSVIKTIMNDWLYTYAHRRWREHKLNGLRKGHTVYICLCIYKYIWKGEEEEGHKLNSQEMKTQKRTTYRTRNRTKAGYGK
jgi:hypothetical protein